MAYSSEIIATRSGLHNSDYSEALQDDIEQYAPLTFVHPLVLFHNQWHIASRLGIPVVGGLKPSHNLRLLGKGLSFTVRAGTCVLEGIENAVPVAMKTPNLGSYSASSKNKAEVNKARSILNEIHVLTHSPLRSHQNIVRLLALSWTEVPDQEEGIVPMLLMEFADLGTLADLQTHRKCLSYSVKVQLCHDVSNGLQALHACGIVHGDVKSENVLVFEKQGKLTAKVSDFGTASILGVAPTSSTDDDPECFLSVGTWPWTAPEAAGPIKRSKLHLTDIYSFGLLAWRVLIDGANPFDDFELPREMDAKMAKVESIKHEFSANHAGMIIGKILQALELELPPVEHFALMWLFLRTITCDAEERSLSGALDHGRHQYIAAGNDRILLAPMNFDILETSREPDCINTKRLEQKIQNQLVKAYQSTLDFATQLFSRGEMLPYSRSYMVQCSWLLCIYSYSMIGAWEGEAQHNMLPFVWQLCQYATGKERQTALSMLFSLVETCSVYPQGFGPAEIINAGIQATNQGVLPAVFFLRRYHQSMQQGVAYFSVAEAKIKLSPKDIEAIEQLHSFVHTLSVKDWGIHELHNVYSKISKSSPFHHDLKDADEITENMLSMQMSVSDKTSELLRACQEGQKDVALDLIQKGHSASVLSEVGESCLHWLHIFCDHEIGEIAKILFEYGASLFAVAIDISSTSVLESSRHNQLGLTYKDNPLCRAVSTGNLVSVRALTDLFSKSGLDVSSKFSIFYEASVLASSLHLASILNHIIMENEIQCESILNDPVGKFRFTIWKSHLFRAATLIETEIFRFNLHGAAMEEAMHATFKTLDQHDAILEITSNFIAKTMKSVPTIFVAILFGSQRVCTYLVSRTDLIGQIDAVDPNTGLSPLGYAIQYGWVDFFHALVRQGAILDFHNDYPADHCLEKSQRTYLHLCAMLRAPISIVRSLISYGIPIDQADKYGDTALFVAICKDHPEMVKALLESGEDLNKPHEYGYSLLGQVFRLENRRQIDNLEHAVQNILRISQDLKKPLDPIVHKEKGLTALHMAAGLLFEEDQSQRLINDLISTFGVEIVNLPTKRGSLAIHEAITTYNIPAIEALLRFKADLTVRDTYGNDLLEIVRVLMLSTAQDAAEEREEADRLFKRIEYMVDMLENARDWPESTAFFKLIRNLEHQLQPLMEHSELVGHTDPRRQQILNLVADTCSKTAAVNLTDWIEVFEFGRHINRVLSPAFTFELKCHFEVDGVSVFEEEDIERIFSKYPWMVKRVSERQLSGLRQCAAQQYYFMRIRDKLRLAKEQGINADLDKEEQLFASLAQCRTAANFPYHQVVAKYPGRLSHDWEYALGTRIQTSEIPESMFDEMKKWDDLCEKGLLEPIEFSQEFIDLHFKPPLQRIDLSKAKQIKPIFRWNLYCSCVDRPFNSLTDEFVAGIIAGDRRRNRKESGHGDGDGGDDNQIYDRQDLLRTAEDCFMHAHHFTIDMPPPIVRPGFDMEGRLRQPFLCGIEDLQELYKKGHAEEQAEDHTEPFLQE